MHSIQISIEDIFIYKYNTLYISLVFKFKLRSF